ncbi:unnamed protein product, partial [Mesorhabditis belari]|uniref:G-protein coupled receptors family 1 profile domain-containing protein n=1 Tax=Mesorhabditis belari TaxID=2138241 RepID=A0AAF3F4F4_9BILA
MGDEDPTCYSVNQRSDTADQDYLDQIDFNGSTSIMVFDEKDCNCSRILHTYLPICANVCPQPFMRVDWMEIMIPALIYLVVFLVGTIGNALVIFVVNRFKRMRNVTNVFLASLSTADLCLIWFCVPIMFVKYMSHEWFMGRFACYSVHYIQQFTCFCSVLTMTMISFERFLAIAYPMRNMWLSSIGRAKKVILLIWLLSAILAIPTAIRIDYQNQGGKVHWCARRFPANFTLFGHDRLELNKYYAIYQMLLLIVFPVATMSICYTRVSLIVYSSSKDRGILTHAMVAFSKAATDAVTFTSYSSIPIANSRTFKFASTAITSLNNKKNNRMAEANKKQIVQMLISIVVMYTVCWLPTIIDELLTSFGYICRTSNTTTLKHMRMGFNALTYCQSCINPICYAFISQNFRATFKTAYIRMKYRLQGNEELRSRMGSYSSASMLSTRNHHRINGSYNTLTVPGKSIITPNMSRDVSQMSLCRPRTPGIQNDAPTCVGLRRSTLASDRAALLGDDLEAPPMCPETRDVPARRQTYRSRRGLTKAFERDLRQRPRKAARSTLDLLQPPRRSLKAQRVTALLSVQDAIRPRTPENIV